MAFRYQPNKPWREEEFFLTASKSPEGSPKRIGRWTVFGVGRGFCEGKEGKSYAISTVDFINGKRYKVSLEDIEQQVVNLIDFAYNHKEYVFLVTKFGTGLAGYKEHEIAAIWKGKDIPDNITFV